MSTRLNADSFIATVQKSGLVPADRLQQSVSEFAGGGGDRKDPQALADHFVDKNLITRWQADKLLQGKHKGYFLGKYRLLSLLGKGGMSSVYLAEHTVMRRRCAIKVLPSKRVTDSSYLARFHREAQAVAALDDPHIVRAYDVDCQTDGESEIHFLVMEYVEGCSLHELVQRKGPLRFEDAVDYARQAAQGLAHAHEAGMVHRDIKPGNLLVDLTGTVKVLDLGLARYFDSGETGEALTIAHDEKVLGTADYLSPEQAIDSHLVDARADIYSLGCTMYYMLTGHPPFTEGSLTQRLMAHQNKEPTPLEKERHGIPPSLAQLVRKLMAKKVDDRFANAEQTAQALLQWLVENASDDWRAAHSVLLGNAAKKAPTMAKVVMARPVAPGAAPAPSAPISPESPPTSSFVNKTSQPPPSTKMRAAKPPAEPVAEDDSLASLFAHLGGKPGPGTPSPAKPPESAKSGIKPKGGSAPKPPPSAKLPAAKPAPATPPASQPAAKPAVAKSAAPKPASAKPAQPTSNVSAGKADAPKTPRPQPAQPTAPVPPAAPREQGLGSFFAGLETPPATAPTDNTSATAPAASPFDFLNAPPVTPAAEPERPIVVSAEPPVPESVPQMQFPGFPGSESVSVPDFPVTVSPPASSKISRKKPASGLPVALLAAAGVAGLAVLLTVAWLFGLLGGDNSGGKEPESVAKGAKADGESEPQQLGGPAVISLGNKRAISVGALGADYKTIAAALTAVRQGFQPSGPRDRMAITVLAGDFNERIVIDATKEPFPEHVTLRGSLGTTLTAPGDGPLIELHGVQKFDLEGFELNAGGKKVAIELTGMLTGTQLANLTVRGFTETGLNVRGGVGEGFQKGELALEKLKLYSAAPTAVGIRLGPAGGKDGRDSSHVQITGCRLFGPMAAGIAVSGGNLTGIALRENLITQAKTAIQLGGPAVYKELTIANTTIHKGEQGIVFTHMPKEGSRDLSIRRTLFLGVATVEAIVERDFNADNFRAMLREGGTGLALNWSNRTPGDAIPGEVDLFASEGRRGDTSLAVDSEDPQQDNFLVAPAGSPQVSGVGTLKSGEQPWIGALGK